MLSVKIQIILDKSIKTWYNLTKRDYTTVFCIMHYAFCILHYYKYAGMANWQH